MRGVGLLITLIRQMLRLVVIDTGRLAMMISDIMNHRYNETSVQLKADLRDRHY